MARTIDDATKQACWDELVRLLIRGATYKQCAEKLGVNENTIKAWIKKPAFQLKLKRTRSLVFEKTLTIGDDVAKKIAPEIEKLIEEYAALAIEKIRHLMDASSSEAIQLHAAKDLADRGKRTSKVHKTQNAGALMVFTPESLAIAAKVAGEINENRAVGREVEAVELDASMVELLSDGEESG